MSVILVEGITDRIALEAAARRLGRDLGAGGVEVVPIGGAQAVARVAAGYDGIRLAGLCDAGEERYFRRALGDAVFVCRADLEDELVRALGPERVESVLATQGHLETFRNFQNQPAWRGRPVDAQLRRWLQASDNRGKRYPPLLIDALDPAEIPPPLAGVLGAVG
jgi:Overcoming lysogenization defect protein-like, TOPRIM domain